MIFSSNNLGDASGFFSRCLNKQMEDHGRSGDGDISAGHVGRYVSLANPDPNSRFMCHVPGLVMYGMLAFFFVAFLWSIHAFMLFFALLTVFVTAWVGNMAISAMFGVWNMQRAAKQDFTGMWTEYKEDHPGCDDGMLHIVVLPNYKEEEEMLGQTLDQLARSILAKKHMVVVLGMEAREGPKGKEKANRLIEGHRHNFKELFATYHPQNIPCEIAGKSSNTQWSFREVQRWYGGYVSSLPGDAPTDASKVFVTVADADSLLHDDYFTALSLNAMQMSTPERSWTCWQPPVLTLRNFKAAPVLTRCAVYGTSLFEVSGLVNRNWQQHMTFSCYTLTLQLANHPMVDGWDSDVIAEDHHMFMKCMMASYWEQIHSQKEVSHLSKVQIEPIWLPVTSYLVEDSSGYWASCYARYLQARRHAQGIAELAYLMLQWVTLKGETKSQTLPAPVHLHLGSLCFKYATMTIFNSVHAFLMFAAVLYANSWAFANMLNGSLEEATSDAIRMEDTFLWTIIWMLMLYTPFLGLVFTAGSWCIVKSSLEGLWCPLHLQTDGAGADNTGINTRKMPLMEQIKLFCMIWSDTNVCGNLALIFYGFIPILAAATGLSKNGHKFEYIVAAKPEGMVVGKKSAKSPTAKKFLMGAEEEELQNLAAERV